MVIQRYTKQTHMWCSPYIKGDIRSRDLTIRTHQYGLFNAHLHYQETPEC